MASTINIDVIFSAINRTGNVMSQVNRGLDGTINNMWKINQAADLMGRMTNTLNQISSPATNYNYGLAELSAITGIAGKDLNDLGKIARKVGKDSGLGATGSLEAYKLLASQIQVDKIGMEGLNELQRRTITLAQASPKLGLTNSANALAGTINQFGYEASQAGRVMNVLAAGAKFGAAEVPDLAQSFKVVGASAAAAGLSVEWAGGAIEVLSKNNLKGAEAGTAFRNVLLKMQTELGFDFRVTKLSDALASLSDKAGDATYMAKIFGAENITAAQFLVKNAAEVENMTRKMTGTNVATEQAAIMTNTFNHRMDVMKAKLNDLSIGFFKNNEGLIQWVNVAGQGAIAITTLSPLFIGLSKGVVGVVGGFVNVVKATRLMSGALAVGKFGTYSALIQRYGISGRVAAGGIWVANVAQTSWNKVLAFSKLGLTGQIAALQGVVASTWAWTAALLANPITWIVAGIMALVAGIALAWKHFDWLRGGIIGAWEVVKKFGKILWESIINPIKLMISGVRQLINAFQLFKNKDFSGAKEALKGGLTDIGKGMVQSTPVGMAMNMVKRRDEMGEAWTTGYEKGKNIDTSNFLNFSGSTKTQPISAADMQIPGFDHANKAANFSYPKVITMTPNWQPERKTEPGEHVPQPRNYVNSAEYFQENNKVNSPEYFQENNNTVQNTNNRTVNTSNLEQVTRNITQNISNTSTAARESTNNQAKIEINYQPQIHISAEMTKENQENLMDILNAQKDELMTLIKEELRKDGRLNYAS